MPNEIKITLIIALFVLLLARILFVTFTEYAQKYLETNKELILGEVGEFAQQYKHTVIELKNELPKYNEAIKYTGLNNIIVCSGAILSKAKEDSVKYIIKYSNLVANIEMLEKIDLCCDYLYRMNLFKIEINRMGEKIWCRLPYAVKMFSNFNKMVYQLFDADELEEFSVPVFTFRYISPAGEKEREYSIEITAEILEMVKEKMYQKVQMAENSKIQRNSMTKDLREFIKLRDGYKCKLCGNSVYNEPNLLLEVDHIIPISKGGKTEADNLQTLCWRCNRAKSDKI